MTDLDIVSRIAMVIARAVRRRAPRCARSDAKSAINLAERHHFPAALACAVAIGMVREDGPHHLAPGGRSPDPWAEDTPPHCVSCTC